MENELRYQNERVTACRPKLSGNSLVERGQPPISPAEKRSLNYPMQAGFELTVSLDHTLLGSLARTDLAYTICMETSTNGSKMRGTRFTMTLGVTAQQSIRDAFIL